MERGVIVGGLLISASFLLAVLLNQSAENRSPPLAAPISTVNTRTADSLAASDAREAPAPDRECERRDVRSEHGASGNEARRARALETTAGACSARPLLTVDAAGKPREFKSKPNGR
jgi:hypothetical protein